MDLQNAASIILKTCEKWLSKNKRGIVVALDGYSGIGKTTIAKRITKRNLKFSLLSIDDYILPLKPREKSIEKTKVKSSN